MVISVRAAAVNQALVACKDLSAPMGYRPSLHKDHFVFGCMFHDVAKTRRDLKSPYEECFGYAPAALPLNDIGPGNAVSICSAI
jgi:hypothetical protein